MTDPKLLELRRNLRLATKWWGYWAAISAVIVLVTILMFGLFLIFLELAYLPFHFVFGWNDQLNIHVAVYILFLLFVGIALDQFCLEIEMREMMDKSKAIHVPSMD